MNGEGGIQIIFSVAWRLRCLLKDKVPSAVNDLTEVLAFVDKFLGLMAEEYSSVFKYH